MRRLGIITFTIFYMLMITFCEYTPMIIDHITNEDNYMEISVTVKKTEFNEIGYSYVYVNLHDYEYFDDFFGFRPASHDLEHLKELDLELKVVTENAAILKANGFFDEIKEGDVITVRTTHWVNNSINYHYIAELTLNDKIYLSFENGMIGMTDAAIGIKDLEYDKILSGK